MKKKSRILVVEDESIIARDIELALESLGFEVCATVHKADDAIKETGINHPDLVLMDVKLSSEKDGIDAAEMIVQRYDVPVVFLTSYTDDVNFQRAKEVGSYGYLIKPFNREELHKTIEMALYRHEMSVLLKENAERFKRLSEASFEGILMAEGNVIVDTNKRLAEMYGYERDELIGKDVRILFCPVAGEPSFLTSEKSETFCEALARRKDSSNFYIEVRSRLNSYSGRRLRVIALHDISDRKRALAEVAAAHQTTHKILEMSPFGVMVVDEYGCVEFVNPAMVDLSGECEEDLMQTNLFKHEGYNRCGLTEKIKEALVGASFALGPVEYSSAKSNEITIKNFTGMPFEEDGRSKVIIYVEDITKRKSVEAELKLSFWKLHKTIETTIYAIAKMVEKRDPYTAGHQERVAKLATAIAAKMKLSEDSINSVYMASLIHDVGKMYVPAEILSKPGQLSLPEFSIIQTHPTFGSDILGDIEFPWPVAESVVQHHERIDGSGYPLGLKGDQIIAEAKIIAVADVVEAMASHRPYRPSLGIEKAIAEIKRFSGIRYDPSVVDACLELYENEEFDFDFSSELSAVKN